MFKLLIGLFNYKLIYTWYYELYYVNSSYEIWLKKLNASKT